LKRPGRLEGVFTQLRTELNCAGLPTRKKLFLKVA
jgi:hypothetical protein